MLDVGEQDVPDEPAPAGSTGARRVSVGWPQWQSLLIARRRRGREHGRLGRGSRGDFGAQCMYQVPPYNLFRVLVRHSMFIALGVSVLAACAIARLRNAPESGVSRRAIVGASAGVLAAFALAVAALARGGCSEAASPGVVASGAMLVLSVVAVEAWRREPQRRARSAALLACIALDLVTFDGWGDRIKPYAGRALRPSGHFEPPMAAGLIAAELTEHKGRLWAVGGESAGREALAVNRNMLWDLPSPSGYSPIAPTHSFDVLDMAYFGTALGPYWEDRSVSLDVSAIRLITIADATSAPIGAAGVRSAPSDLGMVLGSGKGAEPGDALRFPAADVTGISLVLDMEGAAAVPQGSEVALLELRDTGAAPLAHVPLRAGMELSEWSLECPSERDHVRHARAAVYDARPGCPLRGRCWAGCPRSRG